MKIKIILLFLIIISQNTYSKEYTLPQSKLEIKKKVNYTKGEYILTSTSFLIGGLFIGAGILYNLPESVTRWDKDSFTSSSIFGKWKKKCNHWSRLG